MNINLINTSTTILKAASKKGGYYKKVLYYLIPVSFLIIVFQCESPEVFYRPDLPEKLCSIGIIDLDDTTLRHISFEKSFQSEYPVELNDSLRDFSFLISSSNGELFSYHCDSTVKRINDLKIPDNITFNPGEKYYLYAKERDMEEITAEVIAPEPPAEPRLISTTVQNTTLSKPAGCFDKLNVRTVLIKTSFEKNEDFYYAIILKGWGGSLSSCFWGWPGFTDFTVVHGNTPGFFSAVKGLVTYHYSCDNIQRSCKKNPTYAYFIEGKNIPGPECLLTLAIQYNDDLSMFDSFKAIGIKVISIPRELYLFEKRLYTYGKISGDPFAEPIYINGNIKGGNGIFALCRSKELIITFSPMIFQSSSTR
ncbi:MAG: DUF4249 domain-containing protein [Bacteroidales bacterium]|nr:DUF4249 domain-containing protein [Bacteroidales bacterium]